MKIKHFAGYGSVDAKKVSTTTFNDDYGTSYTKMVIKVVGDHEQGIELDDSYDATNWLLTRHFAKNVTWTDVEEFNCKYDWQTDSCVYTFTFKSK